METVTAELLTDELDPLPSVLPPDGVTVARLAAIASHAKGRLDVAGVRGSADAAIIAELARAADAPPIVVVAEDSDAAVRLAGDIAFLLGRKGGDEDDEEGAAVLVL